MAILQALIAALFRSVGRILNTALGWATIMLFGKVPENRQIYISIATLGSVLWLVVLLGVAFPSAGTWLLGFVKIPPWVNPNWVRLGMLGGVVLIPLVVGAVTFLMADREKRAGEGTLRLLLRGYPYTLGLAITLLIMLVFAPLANLRNMARRRTTAHVPLIIQEEDYLTVLDDVDSALRRGGIESRRVQAPGILRGSMKLLAVLGGRRSRAEVADQLSALVSNNSEVLIHPSDLVIGAPSIEASRIRAILSKHLIGTPAYLTYTTEANEVEDRIRNLWNAAEDGTAAAGLLEEAKDLEKQLERIRIPYEEWEILFRQLLLVQRELTFLAAPTSASEPDGTETQPGERVHQAVGGRLWRTVERVVTAVLESDRRPR